MIAIYIFNYKSDLFHPIVFSLKSLQQKKLHPARSLLVRQENGGDGEQAPAGGHGKNQADPGMCLHHKERANKEESPSRRRLGDDSNGKTAPSPHPTSKDR